MRLESAGRPPTENDADTDSRARAGQDARAGAVAHAALDGVDSRARAGQDAAGQSEATASCAAADGIAADPPPASLVAGVARRVRSGAAWVVGTRVLGIVVTMVTQMVLARRLKPDDFGHFVLLTSIVAFCYLPAMFGWGGAILRYVPESLSFGRRRRAGRYLRMAYIETAAGSLAIGALVLLIWPWLAGHMGFPADRRLALLVVGSIAVLSFVQLTADALRGFHSLPLASMLIGPTGGVLCNILFLASLAWLKPDLRSAVWMYLGAMLLVAPLAAVWLAQVVRPRLAGASAEEPGLSDFPRRETLLTCLTLMTIQCIVFLSTQVDMWIAGLNCSGDQLALYNSARRIVLIIVIPLQTANYLVLGSIAELQARGLRRELERMLRHVATVFAIPSILGLAAIMLFAGPLLEFLYGGFYRAAARPLMVMAVGPLMLVVAGSCHCALVMAGQQTKALCVNGLAALAISVGGMFAVRRFGITGLASAYSLVVALESLALLALARRYVGIWTHIDPRVNLLNLLAFGTNAFVAGGAPNDEPALCDELAPCDGDPPRRAVEP